jgi:hypothetical protein
MTLVDVLAAVAIIAATVTTLAPLAVDARASSERSHAALRLRATLSALAPPKEPAGERTDAALPEGCRLRWSSTPLPVAAGSSAPVSTGRLLTMQVVRGRGPAERVEVERSVPMLVGIR